MRELMKGIVCALVVLGSRPAVADDDAKPSAAQVQRLTFEDDIVTGRRDLGDGDYLEVLRPPRLSSLIQPRADFLPELIKSAEDI